ncbi:MAG: FtsW/RodA/SpoVE family cell cycle protein [Micrococcales bacterium]|nr:FtsW/RodA/SpoVE family cell cycle protein [Micrococcales bacterium]
MATILPNQARSGRWVEFMLLAMALGVSFFAYAQVGLAMTGHVPAEMNLYCGAFTVLALAFHLLVRWRAPYADPVLLPVVVTLNGIGLAMIYRLDLTYRASEVTQHADYVGISTKQMLWTVIGVVAAMAVVVLLRDHRILRRVTFTSMILGLIGLLLPLVPGIGATINGSRIWIHLGPLSFQPAELSKVLLAIFFAGYFVTHRDAMSLAGPRLLGLQLPRLRDTGPILLAWAASLAVLVYQKDLGTSLLFFGVFVVMLYVATDRPSWIILGLLLSAGGVFLAYQSFSHVKARFEIWLDPFSQTLYDRDPGGSYQIVQGLFGLGNGGLFGTGWGRGRPAITPLAFSDSIIPSLGEELGLTGLLAILLLGLILAQRGLRTAIGVRDGFGKLLAAGLSFAMAFQVFVVIGGVTRLIPLTGLTVPFLAYGGSSLVANWIIVGLLLRISDGARRPAPPTSEIDLAPVIEAERQRAAANATAPKAVSRV